jgi:hypothetical protein
MKPQFKVAAAVMTIEISLMKPQFKVAAAVTRYITVFKIWQR